ncbi:acetyl-CoA carboxylase biotin carboxylase subunit [Bordetella petrii]|uniref:acetyl-CoA carboxylase biotin carboxylase subunit n=1 Tax=Bordetella petrii TaxID=94624 RepID=UPI001E43AEF6|nr:biotin carboxylase N-terminal domain-containing protein [Bordetella petrii]MCD0504521.1 ATP-grasp domain-containing protein [Bordetella petrii]
MFQKVIVANRGAIASRLIRALRAMGIRSVAVYSEADAGAPYLAQADEAHAIGPALARDSYLDQDAFIDLIKRTGADGLHPGYGFLAENAAFARRVNASGATFIGPSAHWIDAMGHKTRARALAEKHGLPVGKGSPILSGDDALMQQYAQEIGYPVLIKPAAGGGGIGMLVARDSVELGVMAEKARSLAMRGFSNAEIYLEQYLQRPRHIEFQLLGDKTGRVRHLFDRDCSLQRRHQKIIEEARAPAADRGKIDALARHLADTFSQLGYDNIGTVETLMSQQGDFHFLEMNTRLQVEHGVTEAITGVDLVRAQIQAAAGLALDDFLPADIQARGHAIEARVYAEDSRRFLPSCGQLKVYRPPRGLRVETGYAEGQSVTPHYDPMLAKLIAHADTRVAAIDQLLAALDEFEIDGVKTNLDALRVLLRNDAFRQGDVHTGLVQEVVLDAARKAPAPALA